MYEIKNNFSNPINRQKDLFFSDVFAMISFLTECLGFLLVLYILLPTTDRQAKRRKDLQSVFLLGFIDITQLKQAVLDQNQDLDEEERQIICDDLDRFNSFLQQSEMSASIVSEMTIVNQAELPFQGFLRFKVDKALTRETNVESLLSSAEYIPVTMLSTMSNNLVVSVDILPASLLKSSLNE